MEFRILGPLEVRAATSAVRLGGTKQRGVLAMLLLNAGRVVSSDRLIEGLWGESPPETAAKGLHNQVSALRKLLATGNPAGGGPELLTRPPGYLLTLGGADLDLHRFEALRAEARTALDAGNAGAARHKLAAALALWRGPALADCLSEPFAAAEAARLDELRLSALEERIDADLALARHADVVGELEGLIAEQPLRERLRAQLMLALYRSGRQAEALEAYRETRRTLVDELGIEPNRELQELERAMLAQAPALDAPPRILPAPRPAPADLDGSPAAPGSFVGRTPELAEADAALDAALGGETALFLVGGEPGIGKSRFADEVAARAASRAARVFWGRCWEAGGAPAYWPWVQALRTYIRETPHDQLRSQLGRGAVDVAQMLPELRDFFTDLPEPPSLDPEGARFRLFDSTTSFLQSAGAAAPLLLVLDDMHAADPSSLLLLRFLARELRGARVVLLVAYRDSEATSNAALREALVELRREPITRVVTLSGLGRSEVARFVESVAGTQSDPAVAAAIHGETEGNPLFVGELVRLLVSEGRLADVGDDGWLASVPRGLRDVIGQRLRLLSADCKRLLSVASILGREFDLDALAPVSGCAPEELLERLDEALDARVIGEVPGRRGSLRFSHALIRDSLYGELPSAERLRLHRSTAEALETLHGQDLEPHLAELAHHFLQSAPAGGLDKAIDYASRAGERAAALLAYEESARLYGMALEALDLRAATADEVQADLLLALGDVQARGVDLHRARETFVRAAKMAKKLGDPERLGRAALGYGGRFVWFRAGRDPRLVPLLEDALAAQPSGDSVLRARLLARLAGALRDHAAPERRAELTREAVAIARRLGDPTTLASTLEGTYAALVLPRDVDAWLDVVAEIIRLAEEAGDREHLFAGRLGALSVRMMEGDMVAVRAELATASELAEELRQPVQRWSVIVTRGMLALFTGRLEEADRLLEESVRMGRHAQGLDFIYDLVTILQTWALRRAQGRLPEVKTTVEDFVHGFPAFVTGHCLLASLYCELDRRSEARLELEAIAADDFAALHVGTEWFFGSALLAEVCSSLGDKRLSETLYDGMQEYAGYNATIHPEVALGSGARYLGMLAATMERWDDAAAHFERALRANAAMGARPWVAHTQYDYARMLLERDEPGDRERARELGDAAGATFRELGMTHWAERSATAPSTQPAF